MIRFLVVAATLALTVQVPCWAVEVSYRFSGTVMQSSSMTRLGAAIPASSPVLGRFTYDTESPATHSLGDCDCTGYRQQIINGFFATFGNVTIRADEYLVEVHNDRPQPGGSVGDSFTVQFASNIPAPLDGSLFVDGVEQETGVFNVSFRGMTSSLFSNSELPESLNLADFGASPFDRLGFLSDAPGPPEVIASIAVLEPWSPGDYNLDGVVDEEDYLKWWSTFGSTAELAADGNHDGIVDAGDYTIWRDRVTIEGSASASAANVPEPSAIAIVGVLLSVWIAVGFRRRS